MTDRFFTNYFELMNQSIQSVDYASLQDTADRIRKVSSGGKKIILVGNGGSAAMASHVAVDFTKAAEVRAINFNEADLLTCFANDYGFARVFEKAVEFYGDKGDLIILISSSGKSKNVLKAAQKAKEMDMGIITFSGFERDNPLRQLGEINFWVDSKAYNIVEMTHHIWLLAIVDYIIGHIEYSAS